MTFPAVNINPGTHKDVDKIDRLRELSRSPSWALELGKAAEHLLCADLTLVGYRCFLSDQGLPYDVVADVAHRLFRIQVKSTCFARNMSAGGKSPRVGYTFDVRGRGKGNSKRLGDEQCDLVALVGLDVRAIAYLPVFEVGQTCQLLPPGTELKGRYKRMRPECIDQLPFENAVIRFDLGPEGIKALGEALYNEHSLIEVEGERKSIAEWSRISGVVPQTIGRRLKDGWPPDEAVWQSSTNRWLRAKRLEVRDAPQLAL